MTDVTERVRLEIYSRLATHGTAPTPSEVAVSIGEPVDTITNAFDSLAEDRHIVLGPDRRVVMAHPFATIDLGFSVKGGSTLWWGGCVWDAFAIPHLVPTEDEVLVATTCQGCHAAHAWVVTSHEPPIGDQVAHFLVPMAEAWDDVVRTCSNQRVFCTSACLDGWLAREGLDRGYATDLATVWLLASRWYDGRLESPYRRREPTEAIEYFRSAGLDGPFWGLG